MQISQKLYREQGRVVSNVLSEKERSNLVDRFTCLIKYHKYAPLRALEEVASSFKAPKSEVYEIIFSNKSKIPSEVISYLEHAVIVKGVDSGLSKTEVAKLCRSKLPRIERVLVVDKLQKLKTVASQLRSRSFDPEKSDIENFRNLNAKLNPEAGIDEMSVLGNAPKGSGVVITAPEGLPAYLKSLYEMSKLTRAQEQFYFRSYNYLKYRAEVHLSRINQKNPDPETIKTVEGIYRAALVCRNKLVSHNLRLVVSVAKRVDQSGDFFTRVSDGNKSLMKAVNAFDYTLKNKFSTYAVHYIYNDMIRDAKERRLQDKSYPGSRDLDLSRLQGGENEALNKIFSEDYKEGVSKILGTLKPMSRKVIEMRYGLNAQGALDFSDIAIILGISRKAAAMRASRALGELLEAAVARGIPLPFDIDKTGQIKES